MKQEIKEILTILFDTHGTVYGGFVRDMLSNSQFNDIDIWFERKYNYEIFEEILLKKYNCNKEVVNQSENETYFCPDNHYKINISFENFDLKLDIIICMKGSFNSIHKADVNVNRLYLDKYGFKKYQTNLSFLSILDEIKNKTFTPEHRDIPKKRIQKLIDKGWELNPEFLIRDIIE